VIKSFLLAPGPTPVPPEVLAAMALPVIHHRTPQFAAVLAEVQEGLRGLFGTSQDVLVLASSGTGGMEGAVTNLLSPGDEVVVVNGGKFGERWTKICQTYGVVLMQASETSTCALHPVAAIGELTRARDTLLVVDGITAVGVVDLPMDRLGIDVLITGSQKALMLPPGLAFVALSPRAWTATETARLPRFYFDFKRERKGVAEKSTAWTPAISLIQGLRVALTMLKAEGLPNVYARHDRLARATRAAADALGFRLLAPEAPSPAATAIMLPDGIDGSAVFRYLRDRMQVTFAGGQDRLKGKIIRIAHLGYVDAFDVVTGIAALELALHRFDVPVELGRGVGAAERVLADGLPPRG
jgi:aspartate aminotransferase-like enzyme